MVSESSDNLETNLDDEVEEVGFNFTSSLDEPLLAVIIALALSLALALALSLAPSLALSLALVVDVSS